MSRSRGLDDVVALSAQVDDGFGWSMLSGAVDSSSVVPGATASRGTRRRSPRFVSALLTLTEGVCRDPALACVASSAAGSREEKVNRWRAPK